LIQTDRALLHSILANFVSNALRYTERGKVLVGARRRGDFIEIQVADTGIGIAEKDRKEVFEKFKQVGDTLTDRPKGTGLGLPICKQIVEYHGGSIWMESHPGGGSVFSFVLPGVSPDSAPTA